MPFTESVRNVIINKISGKRRVNFMDTKKTLKILAGAALIAVFFPLKLKREYNGDFIYETPVFATRHLRISREDIAKPLLFLRHLLLSWLTKCLKRVWKRTHRG